MEKMDRDQAQARLDRVRAFSSELAQLQRNGVLVLDEAQAGAIADHHARLTADLLSSFDLDRDEDQRRMSLGMHIASVVGAIALSAAVFLFFYRVWGWLSVSSQIAVLASAPLVAVGATEAAARLDRTRHFVFLAAVIACACIVTNVVIVGRIFAMTDSPAALAVFAAFGLLIGSAYRLRVPVAAGLLSAVAFLAGTMTAWTGANWDWFMSRPEGWMPAALLVIAAGTVPRAAASRPFSPTYRAVGGAVLLVALWMLSVSESFSVLPAAPTLVKATYQMLGFVASLTAVAIGLRAGWPEWTYLGAGGFVLFLYTKFFQWFWDWMPAYVFFLVVGLVAIGAIVALRRVRAMVAGAAR